MSATTLCVSAHLPKYLSAIVIDYFGRARVARDMARLGQYEDCLTELSASAHRYMFYGACQGDHLAIVELMIARGADDWNSGLACACFGGHLAIVELMIARGANEWNRGMFHSCHHGHSTITGLMIACGATKCTNCNKSLGDHGPMESR